MEPENQPIPIPQKPHEPNTQEHPLTHTYKDDLAHAMNATDATVVQELLADARERELVAGLEIKETRARKWYSISSLIFILLTLGVIGFGVYYYLHLTVPVQPTQSVGVFPYTQTIVANTTTITDVLETLDTASVPANKPTLVTLVNSNNALLTNSELYQFIDAPLTEPLQSAISVARLGIFNTGEKTVPFIILSVPNPETASKELAIAEPNLLTLFSKALAIDLSSIQPQAGSTFQSQYFYNLPVRTFTAATTTGSQLLFLYGYATNNIIVITTDPSVLKAVYDRVINQH